MFGDFGHGMAILIFSIYLCNFKSKGLHNDKDTNSILDARYLIVLMGFFAMFCGLIYNEFFVFPLNLLGSCYRDG